MYEQPLWPDVIPDTNLMVPFQLKAIALVYFEKDV